MKPSILLIGGGGHCKSCIDVLELEARFRIAGIIDLPEKRGHSILGYPIIGCDDELPRILKSIPNALITLGHIKSPSRRIELFDAMKEMDALSPVIQSPLAYISKHAIIGEGTIIMHHAIINAGARIGSNCIINTKALIEHDAVIQNHCHIATGAIVNGGCIIGDKTFVGSGAISRESTSIPSGTFVKANSLVRQKV